MGFPFRWPIRPSRWPIFPILRRLTSRHNVFLFHATFPAVMKIKRDRSNGGDSDGETVLMSRILLKLCQNIEIHVNQESKFEV